MRVETSITFIHNLIHLDNIEMLKIITQVRELPFPSFIREQQ